MREAEAAGRVVYGQLAERLGEIADIAKALADEGEGVCRRELAQFGDDMVAKGVAAIGPSLTTRFYMAVEGDPARSPERHERDRERVTDRRRHLVYIVNEVLRSLVTRTATNFAPAVSAARPLAFVDARRG